MVVIDDIIKGLGMGMQGAGAIATARKDEICGSKPAFFAKKDKRDAYDACVIKSSDAKINALNAQAEATKNAKETESKSPNYALIIGIPVSIIVIILVIVLIFKRRKNK